MKNSTFLKSSTAPLALGLALVATPAFAQDDSAATGADEGGAPIIVTGSRIARPNIEAASPVTVVGAEQVELTGTTTVETLLNELPMVIPGNTRVSNNSGGENFSTIDLRGLGPGRTLILLDGERLPASSTTGVTDVSQIPTGLIERIEVVTGGASAVYGSDAMAGVINFILKDDFEGVELTGQYGVSEDGVGASYSISGLMGGNFADGRGNFTVYGSWTDRNAVSQGRYDYSRVSQAVYFPFENATGQYGVPYVVDSPSDIRNTDGFSQLVGVAGGSATPPWGWIQGSAVGAAQFNGLATLLPGGFGAGVADTNCDGVTGAENTPTQVSFNDAGVLTPRNTGGACAIPLRSIGSSRYNFAPDNYLVTPADRFTVTLNGRYEFDDATRVKVYGSFTNANQEVNLAPTPATGIRVPITSPLIPADLAAALATRTFVNRLPGATFDLDGDGVADPIAAGRVTNLAACQNVDGVRGADIDAAFCSAPISAAGEDFVIDRRFSETGPRIGNFTTNSKTFRAILEHDLDDTWAVNVVGSFGRVDNAIVSQGNIRRSAVNQGLRGCPAATSGPGCVPIDIFGPNTLTPAMLSFVSLTTKEVESFEQLRVASNLTGSLFELPGGPLGVAVGVEYRKDTGITSVDDAQRTGDIIGFNAVQDIAGSINVKEIYGEVRLPVIDMLAIGLGARYSDYSTVGGLFNWKAEAEFEPTDWIKVRGSYNRAARAPNVFELFQAGDQGFPAFTDPCNATNASRDADFCVAQGVPAGEIGAFQQNNSQVQAFSFGNPNLEEEKAETWTAGVVLSPGRLLGGNLTITADYYNIKLTNRVAGLGAAFFLGQCYAAQDADACARIVRNPSNGQIDSIDTTVTNSATPLITAGVDVGADISFDVLDGRLYFSNVLTYVDKYKIGDSDFVDTAFSGIGGVTPRWANTLTAGYQNETITLQARYVWKKGGKQNFPGADLDGLYPYDLNDPDFTSLYDEFPDRIPDLNLVNLSVRWQAAENFEFTAIVNNILDKYPPQTTTGTFEQANTNISFYDPYALGRTWTIQGRVKF